MAGPQWMAEISFREVLVVIVSVLLLLLLFAVVVDCSRSSGLTVNSAEEADGRSAARLATISNISLRMAPSAATSAEFLSNSI